MAGAEYRAATSKLRFQFGLRTLLAVPFVVALVIATDCFGLIGLHYPRAVDNDPLLAPIHVVEVINNTLLLDDGRVVALRVLPPLDPLYTAIKEVDVEENRDDPSTVFVLGKFQVGGCLVPWDKFINVPLIPHDEPRFKRLQLGIGTIIQNEPDE